MPIQVRVQTDYSLIEYLLETELRYFKKYINEQSINLIKHDNNVKEYIQNEIWTEKSEQMPSYGMELIIHSSYFTQNIFYKSTLITLLSFLESLMKEISRISSNKAGIKLQPNDLKGQGVDWKNLDDLRIVRNYFVHDYLDYSESTNNNKIENIAEKYDSLNYDKATKELTMKDNNLLLEICDIIERVTKDLLVKLRTNG